MDGCKIPFQIDVYVCTSRSSYKLWINNGSLSGVSPLGLLLNLVGREDASVYCALQGVLDVRAASLP